MTDSDKTLRQVLFRWRDETAKAQLGEYEEYGGDILMHYRIIERIVELASVDKLKTLKHLQDQTSWAWTTEYGEEVLELVRKHAAERVVQRDNTAPAAETVQGAQAAPRRVRASPTCSACGEVGHRSTLLSRSLICYITHSVPQRTAAPVPSILRRVVQLPVVVRIGPHSSCI